MYGRAMMLAAVSALLLSGCGESPTARAQPESDGQRINAALAATDVVEVRCTGDESDEQGARLSRDSAPTGTDATVVFTADTRSHFSRSNELWMAKAPLAVKIGEDPVEIAVLDDPGEPKSKLQYVEGGDPDENNTASRVRFLPCGDAKPTWRGYAGAIASDAEPGCVRVVVKATGELPSITSVPLNTKCE